MMDFTIINNQQPFVVMDWEMFAKLLCYLPKIALIENFATDKTTEVYWGELSQGEIIERIFIEFETQ